MTNTLEKILKDYREELEDLSDKDLLFEYEFACIEVGRLTQLVKSTSHQLCFDNQKRLQCEKQRVKICKEIILNRIGGNNYD